MVPGTQLTRDPRNSPGIEGGSGRVRGVTYLSLPTPYMPWAMWAVYPASVYSFSRSILFLSSAGYRTQMQGISGWSTFYTESSLSRLCVSFLQFSSNLYRSWSADTKSLVSICQGSEFVE